MRKVNTPSCQETNWNEDPDLDNIRRRISSRNEDAGLDNARKRISTVSRRKRMMRNIAIVFAAGFGIGIIIKATHWVIMLYQ